MDLTFIEDLARAQQECDKRMACLLEIRFLAQHFVRCEYLLAFLLRDIHAASIGFARIL